MCNEWDKYFGEVKAHLRTRDGLRMTYDHYDRKMEHLHSRRTKKGRKGKNESNRFLKSWERNDVKYRAAADNYARISTFSYKMMHELMEYRARIVNPALIQVINNF